MGYVVILKKNVILSYSDFKDLKVGDTIEKVAAIDDVTTHYYRYLDYYRIEPKEFTKEYDRPSSIHYLTDGILEIKYQGSADGNIVITEIVYNQNHEIATVDNKMTSHKIHDNDLPVS